MTSYKHIATCICCLAATAYCCLTACSKGGETKDIVAAEAAKQIYDSLNNGGFEYFTDMTYRPERIPDGYRKQLLANSKMYIADIRKEHGGIDSITVYDCRYDKQKTAAEAFLTLFFSNGSREEIVVPMTKRDGRWMMK